MAFFGYPADHHPGVGVSHQDHLLQVFVFQQPDYVLDVEVEVDVAWVHALRQVGLLAQTAEGGDEHLSAGLAKQRRYFVPAPAAVPRAVDQYESRHFAPCRATDDGVCGVGGVAGLYRRIV